MPYTPAFSLSSLLVEETQCPPPNTTASTPPVRDKAVPSPLKQKEVDIIVALGEEVSEHARWVAAADLIGRQPEVHTLHEVPKLSHQVLAEFPER